MKKITDPTELGAMSSAVRCTSCGSQEDISEEVQIEVTPLEKINQMVSFL
jgi:hypothetical protein